MNVRPLFEYSLIPYREDPVSGAVTWGCRHYRFAWEKGVLYLGGQFDPVALTKTASRDLAIMFSLGFVAGRELLFTANEVLHALPAN